LDNDFFQFRRFDRLGRVSVEAVLLYSLLIL